MEITKERLQEIKDRVISNEDLKNKFVKYCRELITDLEASQQELADMTRRNRASVRMGWKNKTQRDELRLQLAEAIVLVSTNLGEKRQAFLITLLQQCEDNVKEEVINP